MTPRHRIVSGADHRNGAGHLAHAYEAELRARVQDRARGGDEHAFVRRPSREDQYDPSADNEDRSDERGGPFIMTYAGVEFAYEPDASNPAGATREPFPLS
jgi:hypothetical protein